MTIFFCADLHLGHKNILNFSKEWRPFDSIKQHDECLMEYWNNRVRKKDDIVWVLGDAAFDIEGVERFGKLNGRKILIRGNHDRFPISKYLNYFEEVHGIIKKYGFWLTHAPIHPSELRGALNVHGHTHSTKIPDPRYRCVSMEQIGLIPRSLEEIRKDFSKQMEETK
jgi:calcineurin-like phosphoesterase family protein